MARPKRLSAASRHKKTRLRRKISEKTINLAEGPTASIQRGKCINYLLNLLIKYTGGLSQDLLFEIPWLFPYFPDQMRSLYLRFARRAPKNVWEQECLSLSTRRLDHNQRTVFNIFRSKYKILPTLQAFSLTFPDFPGRQFFSWLSWPVTSITTL